MYVITDIKNFLTPAEFESFDRTYWDNPEQTVELLKEDHPEILLIEENIPAMCSLEGADYRTPSGVVCVAELRDVVSTRFLRDSVLFEGRVLDIKSDVHPSGFCEIVITLSDRVLRTWYDDGIPEGL